MNLNIVYVRFCIFVTQARNKISNLHRESPIGAFREQTFMKFSSLNRKMKVMYIKCTQYETLI